MSFCLSKNTGVETDLTFSSVKHAVQILTRDIQTTLTGTGPHHAIRVMPDKTLSEEAWRIVIRENGIEVYAGDDLGAVYGLLTLSERCLGIHPLAYWTGIKTKRQDTVQVPEGTWVSRPFRVRFRSWFVNDEVLFTCWHVTELERKETWLRVFETVLRCGGNMVIPGTDRAFDGEVLTDMAFEMGLWVTHHHAEPLGAKMFGRVYPDLVPSYSLYPDLFEGLWRDSARKHAGKRILWNVGFRGQGDMAFWHDDPAFDTPAKRGELISQVVARQMEIVREYDPHACFSSNLYGEMMALYREGHLHFPDEVIRVWGDNGYGRMVSRRQNRDNPRVDAMPGTDEAGKSGIYFHVSFYDLQAANHITPLQIPAEDLISELTAVLAHRGDALWNINVGPVKPHLFAIEIIRRMWQDGACRLPDAAQEYAGACLGRAQAAPLLLSYADAAVSYGPNRDDRAGEQFYHFTLRAICHALVRGETQHAVPSLLYLTGDMDFMGQISRIAGLVRPGCSSWRDYVRACRTAEDEADEPEVIHENLTLPGLIHLRGCESLYAVCQAVAHAAEGKDLQAFLWMDRALKAGEDAEREMHTAGRFAHFYDNDCFAGVALSNRVMRGVRNFLRLRGDGEMLYDWERQFLTVQDEKQIRLQTHRTVQLTDDELCLRLHGLAELEETLM